MKTRGFLVIVLACSIACAQARADVVPVVSARSPISGLTEQQIADLFLGKIPRLPGGLKAVPVDQVEGSPARDEFYLKFTGKSPAQVKAFWSKLIFTGRGRPPRMLPDSVEVLKAVRENPLAVGYVDRRHTDSTVRILP